MVKRIDQDSLDHFQELLPQVRSIISKFYPQDWNQFRPVMELLVSNPAGPLSVLPLASCSAAGGDAHEALYLAAAWRAYSQAMRILDDVQDRDREGSLWATAGNERAFNFGAALYVLCHQILANADWPAERHRDISQMLSETGIRLLSGQDRDLRGDTLTMDDYWQTIEQKNAAAFAFICAAGARCATENSSLIELCGTFGYHLGIILQLFDDYQGIWEPEGQGDLKLGKITLPLLYGLSHEHDRKGELKSIVAADDLGQNADRIREILDQAGAREFMIWTALQEQKQAISTLKTLPGEQGVDILESYASAAFAHIDELLSAD